MAFMRLGSKSDAFYHEGQTWNCTTGLPSDVTVKFPLLSRSGLLKKFIADLSTEDGSNCVLQLHDVPGGDKTFELVTKFCYSVKIEVTASNVVSLRCAAEYLQMNENYGEGNLIAKTEAFLNEIFSNWSDSIKALQTCEEVKSCAEELRIISRCIDSLAMKVCSESNMFNKHSEGYDCSNNSAQDPALWNGISPETKSPPPGDAWWYEDLSMLCLPLYKRLILSIEAKGMKPENVAGSLIYYIRKFIPLMNRQASFNDKNSVNQGTTTNNTISEADQKALLEEIMGLLPNKKEVTPSKYLLRLLRAAMKLHASPSCIENLEKRIGSQLNQAHPWLIDSEREQFCRLMNCQKLSLEASTHAAQNERLPLRVIVQVLFFEQLRLRTSISSWLYVSENLENSQNNSGNLVFPRNNGTGPLDPKQGTQNLKDLVSELEKECSCIRSELQKLAKTKKSWSILPRIFCRKHL
ncbi:hypothetical protein Fmac_027631 [Flemingia macrophylla]|uniref:NPH3 domain-containing protein n=1 Tax=Flemingia macrophylla TaxID=520843 RepID=A0ABD1LIF1_9FABA